MFNSWPRYKIVCVHNCVICCLESKISSIFQIGSLPATYYTESFDLVHSELDIGEIAWVKDTEAVFDVMTAINLNAPKATVIVSKEKKKILGTVTDGDLRRAFLKNITPDDLASLVMANKFKSVKSISCLREATEFLDSGFKFIPILESLDINKKTISIFTKKKVLKELEGVSALIMAGGKGTRLLPLTENTPKPLIKVNGVSMIESIINQLRLAGIKEITISIGHLGQQIVSKIGSGAMIGVNIDYIDEKVPTGTAGSLRHIITNKDIFVINADIMTQLNFGSFFQFCHGKEFALAAAVVSTSFQIQFGVVDVADGKISHISEKPIRKENVLAGMYLIKAETIKKIKRMKAEKIDMTEIISWLLKSGQTVLPVYVYEPWVDVGDKKALAHLDVNPQTKIIND